MYFRDNNDEARFIPIGEEEIDFIPVGREDEYITLKNGNTYRKSDWDKWRIGSD